MVHWIDDETGDNYVSTELLFVSDYAGAGAVGEANIRHCEQNIEGCHVRYGDFYSRQAWLPDTEENRELIRDLEHNYSLLDEDLHGRVIEQWTEEAWESHVRAELLNSLPEYVRDLVDSWQDEDLYENFRFAMEETQTYAESEYSGVHINIDRLVEHFLYLCQQDALNLIHDVCSWFPTKWEDVEDDYYLVAADWMDDKDKLELAQYLRAKYDAIVADVEE